ncbi:MAG: LuxR C-terminal-related transcriptional regulator [Sphingorhabdus sp.]
MVALAAKETPDVGFGLLESVTIRTLEDIRAAAIALHDAALARGLRVAATADIASKGHIVDIDGEIINGEIFGWVADGERWWENTRLAFTSPLPRACRYESEPMWCNSDGFHVDWNNPYLDELDLSNFHGRTNCHAAILVPVHLPFGQIGALSFTSTDIDRRDLSEEFAAHVSVLAPASRRFIAGYVGVTRTQRWMPSNCRLSKREAECLRWAAVGKTDKEIGLILTLSHATVRFHIQRAGEKLNAVKRSQTIFKAGQLGYLGAAF